MKNFFATKSAKILISTVAVLLVFTVLGAAGNPWLSSAFNFLTKGLSKVSSSAAQKQKSLDDLKKENKKLRDEAADLRARLVDYYDVKNENARLWKYYEIKKINPDFKLMPGSVIRRDTNEEFYSFTIDAGTSAGVSKLDPVITENGVVGFVSSVNASTSKVTTILSPDFKAGAVDKNTDVSGVVSGSAILNEENKAVFTKTDANAKVKKGDIITTSGIGGLYPGNLILGKVSDIRYDEYDASKYAVVTPYEDISAITDVVVVTDFTDQGKVTEKGAQ